MRNNIFVYSHKTQLCAIKYVYYAYYNDTFRPSTAIIRLYMKTSSIYTIYHRSSVWMGWVGGYFARSRLGLGCADQLGPRRKCWDGSHFSSKLPLHASHVALPN